MLNFDFKTFAIFNLGVISFFVFFSWLLEFFCDNFFYEYKISKKTRENMVFKKQPYRIPIFLINSMQIGTFLYIQYEAYFQQITNLHTKNWSIFSIFFETLLILFILDTWFYWTHRLGHNFYIYRLFHRTHHLIYYPTAFDLQYQHPVDYFITTTSPYLWILFLPFFKFHLYSYITAILMANFVNIAGHSGYEISHSLFLLITVPSFNAYSHLLDPSRIHISKLLNNVIHHDIHHHVKNKNFSLYFTLWDRVCNTYQDDTDQEEIYLKKDSE
jgi:sterol desaturase/sphingolipid hydroxylase (fatty acid hydroxylase superfamily)